MHNKSGTHSQTLALTWGRGRGGEGKGGEGKGEEGTGEGQPGDQAREVRATTQQATEQSGHGRGSMPKLLLLLLCVAVVTVIVVAVAVVIVVVAELNARYWRSRKLTPTVLIFIYFFILDSLSPVFPLFVSVPVKRSLPKLTDTK